MSSHHSEHPGKRELVLSAEVLCFLSQIRAELICRGLWSRFIIARNHSVNISSIKAGPSVVFAAPQHAWN